MGVLDGTWGLDNIFGKGVPTIFSNSSGYTDASNGKVDETKLKDLNYMLGQADYYNSLNPTQSLQYLGNSGYSRRHFAKTLQKGVRNSNWADLNSDLLSQLKALGIDSEDSFNEFKGLGASGRWKLAKKALFNANNNAFQQHAVQTRLDELIKNNLLFLSGLVAPVKPAQSILSVQPEKPYAYNGIKEGVTDWNGNAGKIFGILGSDFVKLNVDTNGDGEIDQTEYNNFLQGLGQGRNFSDGKYGNASINGIISKYGITGDLLTLLQGLITKPTTPVDTVTPPPISGKNDYNSEGVYQHSPYRNAEAYNTAHPGGGLSTLINTNKEKTSINNPFYSLLESNEQGLYDVFDGIKYMRYDPFGRGDYYVAPDGTLYNRGFGGGLGSKISQTDIKDIDLTKENTAINKSLQSIGNINNYGSTNHVQIYNRSRSHKNGGNIKLITKKYK